MSNRAILQRITWFNRAMLVVLAAGAVLALVKGLWIPAVVLAVAFAIMAALIVRAAGGGGSDQTRIDAAQPYDEREARVALSGFALAGQVAVVVQTGLVIYAMVTDQDCLQTEAMRLFLLGAVVAFGNARALRNV